MQIATNGTAARSGRIQYKKHLTGGVTGLLMLTFCSAALADKHPALPDANAIVRKMIAVYKKATSVQADFEAQIIRVGGSEYIQSGNIRFTRPDKVELLTTDPITGTFQAWSDGRTIAVYSGKSNVYTKRTAPPGLGPTISAIERTSTEVLRVRSTQLFSPLSFILANGMPREAQNFFYLKQDTVLGKKVHCITAKMNVDFIREIVENPKAIPVQRDVKLWIDINTNQLVRSASTLIWKIPLPTSPVNKPAYSQDGFSFMETYQSVIFDAPVNNSVFHFDVPLGAKQLFQERR